MLLQPEIAPFKRQSKGLQKSCYQPLPDESQVWKDFKNENK
jgi:hypothetical protein